MPKSSFVDFRAVKAAITMEQVLEHYGLLDKFTRKGDSLSGPCPIHGGSNPTQFRVSISKNIFNCFSECKHGGNVLDFIAKMEDVSIHAAALKAIDWFKLDPDAMRGDSNGEEGAPSDTKANGHRFAPAAKVGATQKPKPAPPAEDNAPNAPLKFKLDKLDRSHPYLTKERGLTQETIVDFGLGYFTGEKGLMVGRIAIPIHNVKGELVAYAGRWPGEPPDEDTEKYKLPPRFNKLQELFNIDRAMKEPRDMPLVIVEGFFDVINLHQCGYRKAIALMGNYLSDAHVELIRTHTDSNSQVIVMLDEDEAGRDGRDKVACRLSKFCFVKVHEFEKEGTQPDQLSADEVDGILGGVL